MVNIWMESDWLFLGEGRSKMQSLRFGTSVSLREYCLISCDYWINLNIANTVAKDKNAACVHRSRPALGESLLHVFVVPLLLKNHNWVDRIQVCRMAAKPKGTIIDVWVFVCC